MIQVPIGAIMGPVWLVLVLFLASSARTLVNGRSTLGRFRPRPAPAAAPGI